MDQEKPMIDIPAHLPDVIGVRDRRGRLVGMLHKANVPKHIANHLLGEEHSTAHRLGIGAVIAICGVAVMRIHVVDIHALSLCLEAIGGLIHALGITPYVELAIDAARPDTPER